MWNKDQIIFGTCFVVLKLESISMRDEDKVVIAPWCVSVLVMRDWGNVYIGRYQKIR